MINETKEDDNAVAGIGSENWKYPIIIRNIGIITDPRNTYREPIPRSPILNNGRRRIKPTPDKAYRPKIIKNTVAMNPVK